MAAGVPRRAQTGSRGSRRCARARLLGQPVNTAAGQRGPGRWRRLRDPESSAGLRGVRAPETSPGGAGQTLILLKLSRWAVRRGGRAAPSRQAEAPLQRGFYTVQTEAGPVRFKTAEGFGVSREKPEFEDLARIAREQGISLREAAALAEMEQ